MALHIEKIAKSKISEVDFNNLTFGKNFTDHMFECDYEDGKWLNPQIVPYHPLTLDPSAKVFHYGQAVFEGMKAYKDDHDDVWLAHKIQDSLTQIQTIENGGKAALVFTDLIITDEKLKPIHPSFWNYSKINPQNIHSVYKLAINNPVVGCTVMLNRQAKGLVLPIPDGAIMHDWWAALKVAEKGAIDYIEKPSILYRQHNANEIGAYHVGFFYFLRRFFNFPKTIRQNKDAYRMLKTLNKKYSLIKFVGYKISNLFSKAV